eukprot:TRINITY_DN47736_c0_g1_i1.p1 TRINITY_DN47736_c0_g1~~TRINITY_DN47736_c0_g1_i1.p1  ORF type:complete len:100 (-),score=1.57 TRINITY_DN47736_c0_g1_i1:300-599(-)
MHLRGWSGLALERNDISPENLWLFFLLLSLSFWWIVKIELNHICDLTIPLSHNCGSYSHLLCANTLREQKLVSILNNSRLQSSYFQFNIQIIRKEEAFM